MQSCRDYCFDHPGTCLVWTRHKQCKGITTSMHSCRDYCFAHPDTCLVWTRHKQCKGIAKSTGKQCMHFIKAEYNYCKDHWDQEKTVHNRGRFKIIPRDIPSNVKQPSRFKITTRQ